MQTGSGLASATACAYQFYVPFHERAVRHAATSLSNLAATAAADHPQSSSPLSLPPTSSVSAISTSATLTIPSAGSDASLHLHYIACTARQRAKATSIERRGRHHSWSQTVAEQCSYSVQRPGKATKDSSRAVYVAATASDRQWLWTSYNSSSTVTAKTCANRS